MLEEDYEVLEMMRGLEDYLEMEKVFIPNAQRCQEVCTAFNKAKQLFDDADISVTQDPLQMGALILGVNDVQIEITGTEQIIKFMEMISVADNFIVYSVSEDKVRLAITFQNALIRLP